MSYFLRRSIAHRTNRGGTNNDKLQRSPCGGCVRAVVRGATDFPHTVRDTTDTPCGVSPLPDPTPHCYPCGGDASAYAGWRSPPPCSEKQRPRGRDPWVRRTFRKAIGFGRGSPEGRSKLT